MKRILVSVQLLLLGLLLGCGGGMNTPPPPLAFYAPPEKPFGHSLAIGIFQDKSFARYPEIKASSTGAAERFIIGTFVSVLFASACALAAAWLIRLF